jgi:predicted GNAT family acetyltransferase
MADITITRDDNGQQGRYVARIAGIDGEAELTFTHRGPGRISGDHTGAPESMRGTGAAAALVERLVTDARAQGIKIIPLCPYIRARYAKNPDWQDVMTVAPGETPTI